MKNILITAGGTREYIDDVRVLTNISTGKLGALIASKFRDDEYNVHYVAPKNANFPDFSTRKGYFYIKENYYHYDVTDVNSVYDVMKELVPKMDVVIHCMAVSDFGFKPANTKLKSNDPIAFIESLKDRIYQTPKILKEIKKWNPKCKLISFKFEVGLKHEELMDIAIKSGLDNNCDFVIANDKKEMQDNKSHIAYAIELTNYATIIDKLQEKNDIAEYIFNKIK